jgi:hypothetical protein
MGTEFICFVWYPRQSNVMSLKIGSLTEAACVHCAVRNEHLCIIKVGYRFQSVNPMLKQKGAHGFSKTETSSCYLPLCDPYGTAGRQD